MLSRLIAQTTDLGQLKPISTVVKQEDLATGTGVVTKLESVISEVLGLITIVGGIALLMYFVLGALNWISAAGDTGKIEKARNQMVQAVSGMVLVVAAYGLIGVISTILGIHILNPGAAILQVVNGTPATP